MKKVILVLTAVIMCVALAGCSSSKTIVEAIEDSVSAEEFEACVADNENAVNKPYYSTPLWKLLDDVNYCPIHYAVKNGDTEKVSILLKHGADPNLEDPTVNRKPLAFALLSGTPDRFAIAELLIENGADIEIHDKNDDIFSLATVLTVDDSEETVKAGTEFVKSLIQTTDYTNNKDKYDPIIVGAATYGNTELVQYLLDNHIDEIDDSTEDGITPLMGTTLTNEPDMCRFLFDNGADKTKKSKEGLTAYDYAERYGRTELMELLKE